MPSDASRRVRVVVVTLALLACAPTAFMTKKKHDSTQDADHIPGDISETRAGGAAALALAGKADELVAKGGILSYLKSRSSAAMLLVRSGRSSVAMFSSARAWITGSV